MGSAMIQLIVLAGVAVFLILRLRNVLGTREGFEKPSPSKDSAPEIPYRRDFEVIEGGVDRDIGDHVDIKSKTAKALMAMKAAEPEFSVSEFLSGARGAYEMIIMGFESGNMDALKDLLSPDVFDSFSSVVSKREKEGLSVDASFVGVGEMKIKKASFDKNTQEGEVTIRFVAELTSVVKDRAGEIVEGHPTEIKKQRDIWTFARAMGSNDPNWRLVATGE